MLFIGKQHVYINCCGATYLQGISVFMQNFKFSGVMVLAVQLFNKIKRKKKKKTKNLKKTCFAVFPGCYVEIDLFFCEFFLFFMF